MIEFSCPNCGTGVKAREDKIGAHSRCPRCGFRLQVPDPVLATVPNGPLPAAPQWNGDQYPRAIPVQHQDESVYQEPTVDVGALVMAGLTKTWWLIDTIFDFRFRRYLTPYLVRGMWALLLVSCICGFFLFRFAMPLVEHYSKPTTRPAVTDRIMFEPPAKVSEPNPVGEWLGGTILYVWLCMWFLIYARILAELVIVIFNISNDLKEAKRRYEEIHAAG
jgi:DNA-directed RNA polymerase subunit RPC12/RpoP